MRSHSDSRPRLLPWLTVLRYPAALWVVLLHSFNATEIHAGGMPDSPIKLVAAHGYLGVSFFFMLSGFILTCNHPVIDLRPYLVSRAARILPVYYLSLLFALPIASDDFAKYGASLIPISACILTLSQAWIPAMSSFWNGPAWTLSCEAFFYIALPGLLLMLNNRGPIPISRGAILFIACFLTGLILPAIFTLDYGTNPYTNGVLNSPQGDSMQMMKLFIERFPVMRLLDFVSGVVLCLSARAYLAQLSLVSGWLLGCGILWVIGSFYVPFIFTMGSACQPGFALIILGAAALPFPASKSHGPGSVGLLLGNASYAVYLLHASMTGYLLTLNDRWIHFLPASGAPFFGMFFLIVTLVTTALSILIFRFYEEPSRRWLTKALGAKLKANHNSLR